MPDPILGGELQMAQGDVVGFNGVFTVGAVGAVTNLRVTAGIAVARTAVGVYTITLPKVYNQIIFPGLELQQTAAVALIKPRIASTATVNGRTVLTVNLPVAAGTNTEAATGDVFRFFLLVSDSRFIQ